jgi:hypothetical protein
MDSAYPTSVQTFPDDEDEIEDGETIDRENTIASQT